jgi:hypothetical protein
MAESSTPTSLSAPALPPTGDAAPYVPVSWLAVAAMAVAGFLGLLLAIMGFISFRARRPLLEPELLILAVVAVVLSFAARRIIRNSEGTRTGTLFGIDLPNAAWWGGLVLGLGYASYLLAIEFSIRNDAHNEMQTWSDFVMKGDEESLNRAFHRTQDPSQRKLVQPTDGAQLEGRWGKDYIAFRQSDLRRLLMRNPDAKLELGGLRDWHYRPTGIECTYTATLTCAEGTFPILVPLRGVEGAAAGTDAGGRQWQVYLTPSGFIEKERARLTPYGWFVANLNYSGADAARRFLTISSSREGRCMVYTEFGSPPASDLEFFRPLLIPDTQTRSAVTGATAAYAFRPGDEFLNRAAKGFYRLPGGAEPNAERLAAFSRAWNDTGIVKAGERLRESTDLNDLLLVSDTAITYRSPIEVPLVATRGEVIAARGGIVFECTDPAVLAEAKRLREEANPAIGTDMPEGLSLREFSWKVVRIESDMKPIRMEMKTPPGGGPPGAGPPGH